jgi:hypothetical protein
MHGIVRTRNLKEGPDPKYTNIRRIEVRYSDGLVVRFVAEARREFFSGDDSAQLAKVLTTASSTAEWAPVREEGWGG